MTNFQTPTMFLPGDVGIELARNTMSGGISRDNWSGSFDHFTKPSVLENKLGSEMVALFAELQFGGWQERKDMNAEGHQDAHTRYDKLSPSVKEFIKSMNIAKLAAHAAYLTQDGIRALIEIGKEGKSISEITHLAAPDGHPELTVRNSTGQERTLSPIHVAMLEIHHDVWLNINGQNKREHLFCLENHVLRSRAYWDVPLNDFPYNNQLHTFPYGIGVHAYNVDAVQVDKDAVTLALMPSEFHEKLIALAQPDKHGNFFRPDASFYVRNPSMPVLSPLHGLEVNEIPTSEALNNLGSILINRQQVSQWYTAANTLSAVRIPLSHRALVKKLFYTEDGNIKDAMSINLAIKAIEEVSQELSDQKRRFENIKPDELSNLLADKLQEITARS